MTLRLAWDKSKYWHDIFASPNTQFLWHRYVYNGTANSWYRIVEETTNRTWSINIGGNANTATTAVNATNDSSGNNIVNTYARINKVYSDSGTYRQFLGKDGSSTD